MNSPDSRARLVPLPPVFPFPWAVAYGEDHCGLWQAFEVAGVRQVLRFIPPGRFQMGSPETEAGRWDGERQHSVTLTRGFWLGETACTQALWRAVLGDNPSDFKGNEEAPVEQVSWDDVTERFLPALNGAVAGLEAVLPHEAQWEYACRAGSEAAFWFGSQINTAQVNFNGNEPMLGGHKSPFRKRTVGAKALPANDWGLFQMHGNVLEWCADESGLYPEGETIDPIGRTLSSGSAQRVLRGGSWIDGARYCRSANRIASDPANRYHLIGFRLARGSC